MKYHQSYPVRRFRDLLSVQAWVDCFLEWYNIEHRHRDIKNVTPNQLHYGDAVAICSIRQQTYEQARQQHPLRQSRPPRDW
jgi:putative transposase